MGKDKEPQPNREVPIGEDYTPLISMEVQSGKFPVSKKASRGLLGGYVLLNTFLMGGLIGAGLSWGVGSWFWLQAARDKAAQSLAQNEIKIRPYQRIETVDQVDQGKLIEWQNKKWAYQQTFYEAINYNNSENIIKPLQQLAVNHTLFGAELLNKALVPAQFTVDYKSNKLTINEASYDLSKPRDFHLASAIVDTQISFAVWNLETQKPDSQRQEEARNAIKEAESDLDYLYYVDEKIENIYFTKDSFLYFPRELFVAMGKITQALDRHGFPLPKTVMAAKAGSGVVGEYFVGDNSLLPFTVILRENIWDGGVVHEWGHFISDVSNYEAGNTERNVRVSLDNYQKVVESAQLLDNDQVKNPSNQFLSEHAKKNVSEDYAYTFEWYFWQGDDLRKRLEELATSDPAAFQILKAKYDFFKNVVFEEEEFANKGEVLNR